MKRRGLDRRRILDISPPDGELFADAEGSFADVGSRADASMIDAAVDHGPNHRSHYQDRIRVDMTIDRGTVRLVSQAVLLRTLVRALQAGQASVPARIGLTLTDDAQISGLNETHMGHEGPTDVLSFPLLPPAAFPPHDGQDPAVRITSSPAFVLPPGMRTDLGDIVISVERAIEQAEQGRGGQTGTVRWSAADELRLLVTHGALHVCGWDHALPAEEAAMRALEERLLSGIPRAR